MVDSKEGAHSGKQFWIGAKGWMIVSIVLVVLVVFSSSYAFSGVGKDKAADLIEDYLYGQGLSARVSDVKSVSGVYQADVTVGGQSGTLYLTKDGKYVGSMDPLDTTTTTAGGNIVGGSTGSAEIEVGDSPSLGSVDAKVTVVEFSDFSCPFCAAASGDNPELVAYMKRNNPSWEPIVTNLIKDYVDTGKVRFVVKYSMGHSGGHPAQLVAWCLNEQNLYWKFYPEAFANQDDVEDLDKMTALAKKVGADMNKLNACLDSDKYESRFTQEQSEGASAGVSGTPAFFVNGRLIEGAVPYSQVKAVIESELAK